MLLEWPLWVGTGAWQPFVAHQLVHGLRVVGVAPGPIDEYESAGVRFDNMTDLNRLHDWTSRGARYLVLNLDFIARSGSNANLARSALQTDDPDSAVTLFDPASFAPIQRMLSGPFGGPVYRNEQLLVYDLLSPPRFTWATGSGRNTLLRWNGARFDLTPSGPSCALDLALMEDARLRLAGWAFDPRTGRRCDAVVVMLEDRFLLQVLPDTHRAKLRNVLGPEAELDAGFQIWLDSHLLGGLPAGRVCVFGLARGKAWPMQLLPGTKWLQQAPAER